MIKNTYSRAKLKQGEKNENSPLEKKWRIFVQIAADPLVIILILITLALLFLLFFTQNTMVVRMLTIFISIAAALLTSYASHLWSSLNEKKLTIARGKVAVRSLRHLFGNILSADRRVCQFLQRFCDDPKRKKITNEVIKTYLEEIINRYEILEEETKGSIENWEDILPGESIKAQIIEIKKLRKEVGQQKLEIAVLEKNLTETEGRSEKEGKRLKNEIMQKEEELSDLQIQLQTTDLPFSSGSKRYLRPGEPDFINMFSGTLKLKCLRCQWKTSDFTKFKEGKCPKCGGDLIGVTDYN